MLTDVEAAAVLVAILACASEDETGRLAGNFWNITRSDPDLTEAGVRFGLKQLADRRIIEATSLDTQDGPVAAWTPSSTGWSWLKATLEASTLRFGPAVGGTRRRHSVLTTRQRSARIVSWT